MDTQQHAPREAGPDPSIAEIIGDELATAPPARQLAELLVQLDLHTWKLDLAAKHFDPATIDSGHQGAALVIQECFETLGAIYVALDHWQERHAPVARSDEGVCGAKAYESSTEAPAGHFILSDPTVRIADIGTPKACPFCCTDDVHIDIRQGKLAGGSEYCIAAAWCSACGAEAPEAATNEEGISTTHELVSAAAARWNDRRAMKDRGDEPLSMRVPS
jgi:hypothetical protein